MGRVEVVHHDPTSRPGGAIVIVVSLTEKAHALCRFFVLLDATFEDGKRSKFSV